MSPLEEKLHSALEASTDREGFVRFLEVLLEDLRSEGDTWTNQDLEAFLSGLVTVARKYESYFDTADEAAAELLSTSWQRFAEILFTTRCARDEAHRAP
jgi:hypothetical protein